MACPQGRLGCSPRPHRTLVTQSPMAQGRELPEDPAVPERGPSGRHLPGEVGPLFSTTGFAKSPPAPLGILWAQDTQFWGVCTFAHLRGSLQHPLTA